MQQKVIRGHTDRADEGQPVPIPLHEDRGHVSNPSLRIRLLERRVEGVVARALIWTDERDVDFERALHHQAPRATGARPAPSKRPVVQPHGDMCSRFETNTSAYPPALPRTLPGHSSKAAETSSATAGSTFGSFRAPYESRYSSSVKVPRDPILPTCELSGARRTCEDIDNEVRRRKSGPCTKKTIRQRGSGKSLGPGAGQIRVLRKGSYVDACDAGGVRDVLGYLPTDGGEGGGVDRREPLSLLTSSARPGGALCEDQLELLEDRAPVSEGRAVVVRISHPLSFSKSNARRAHPDSGRRDGVRCCSRKGWWWCGGAPPAGLLNGRLVACSAPRQQLTLARSTPRRIHFPVCRWLIGQIGV